MTDYIAGGPVFRKHYKNGNLEFFQHAEGRVTHNSGTFAYEYNLTDHLGNVRVTVDQSGTVVQKDDYYPFGLTFNSSIGNPQNYYKYNGIEQNPKTKLYETAYRGYDASIGRFNQVDPLTNKIPGISTYHFGFNNPVRFNDPLGLMGDDRTSFLNSNSGSWETHAERIERQFIEGFERDRDYGGNSQKTSRRSVTKDDIAASFELSELPPEYVIWEETFVEDVFVDREYALMFYFYNRNIDDGINNFNTTVGYLTKTGLTFSNFGLGVTSTILTIKGKNAEMNGWWHVFKDNPKHYNRRFITRFDKRWGSYAGVRQIQKNKVKGVRSLSTKFGIASGALLLADVGLSGELKPSHGINAVMIGISFTGVGAVVAGVYFVADFATMGVNLAVNGEAKGIGDLIDDKYGSIKLYDGIY